MKFRVFLSAIAGVLALPAVPALAQPATVQGPVSGYLYQRGRGLRPLLGVPGAAYAGAPILNEVDAAFAAPGGKWAIVSRDGHLALVPLSGTAPGDSSNPALLEGADRVVWNRGGSAVLLYSSTRNLLQLVRFSGALPAADDPIDLSAWGAVAALALDATGRKIAAGIPGAGLLVFDASQPPALASAMAQPTAAAFDDNGRVYAVDAARQRLFQFNPGESESEFAVLSNPDGPTVDAADLAVSGDGHYVMLADRAAPAVRVYETGSHALTDTLALDFAPTRFEAVSGTLFLLNGEGENAFRLLDTRSTPALFFVPASTEEQQ